MLRTIILATVCGSSLLLSACGGSSGTNSSTPATQTPATPTATPVPDNLKPELSLSFKRLESTGLDPIQVNLELSLDGQPHEADETLFQLDVSRGSLSALSRQDTGKYFFTLTPDLEAEYQLTITYGATAVSETLLVLDTVHPEYGQPMAVKGLVNTAGYEDGATVTPDGKYLFVQYSPAYFSSLLMFPLSREQGGCAGHRLQYPEGVNNRCTHLWYDSIIGPAAAPERPGFMSGRIDNSQWRHSSNSWGIGPDQTINLAISSMFYGFERSKDGSYRNPFYIAFEDDNDGIINPYGLSVIPAKNGNAIVAFAMDDPGDSNSVDLNADGTADIQSYFDAYSSVIKLGENNSLGRFTASGTPGTPPLKDSTSFPSQKITFSDLGIEGLAGTQGNPHLQTDEMGSVIAIWTDDEYDDGGDRDDLSVYLLTEGSFPEGSWQKVVLPAPVNQDGNNREFQPFFIGNQLIYSHATEQDNPIIVRNIYNGQMNLAELTNTDKWEKRETLLASAQGSSVGSIIAVGEPSTAIIDGEETLFFIYGVIRGYDPEMSIPDIDMQVGFVKKKAESFFLIRLFRNTL